MTPFPSYDHPLDEMIGKINYTLSSTLIITFEDSNVNATFISTTLYVLVFIHHIPIRGVLVEPQ